MWDVGIFWVGFWGVAIVGVLTCFFWVILPPGMAERRLGLILAVLFMGLILVPTVAELAAALASVERRLENVTVLELQRGYPTDIAHVKYFDGKSVHYLAVQTSDIIFVEKDAEGLQAEVSVPNKLKLPAWAPSFLLYPRAEERWLSDHRVTVTIYGPPETIKSLIEKL